ncbi:acyltransferase [Paraglaciecola marina]|uniref:acyltransferase n=1 Tax=Paraglaciecola marina TaxID=2500157 RepID=UPI00105E1DE9|nr:acyltransferase [Paraglaciecola marina]
MKNILKSAAHILFKLLALPIYCLFWLLSLVGSADGLFSSFGQFFSLFPGMFGVYLRAAFYRFAMTYCDNDVVVGFGTLFSQQDTEIYSGTYIGPQCNIGKSTINRNCLIGSGVHILSGKGQHNFDDINTPLKDQGGKFEKVTIGEDSWLGNGSIIMASVGKKCVVAAGSVVVNEVPDYAIVAGNPAKIIRSREV